MESENSRDMMEVEDVAKQLPGLSYERIHLLKASSYRDTSTVVVCPTRGMIHQKVVNSWMNLITPMNQKKVFLFCAGAEVGHAYNAMVGQILNDPGLRTWKYLMTVEDDNVLPPDAHIRLLETIADGYDAVSGIYFTKGDWNMPMAYGSADHYRKTGELTFEPQDIRTFLAAGRALEVNGIGMGCALWRMEMFREIPPPWFVTLSDVVPDKGAVVMTQDLYFCKRAREAGKRFAVDCRVKVGHLDPETGIIY
jgi:hypothetical protein